ncbi:MAG: NAD-dependent epimerase/dehydratase family protein [Anaerolineae bacterium]|nr:NAD-dependent epimerase/dehydratase family protein [Anaerolineae bacterium]
MKILLTGGAGFIGSHLAEAMLAKGHKVVIIDNLATGKRAYIPPEATFYETDICDPQIEAVFETEQPDMVCHHAAQMSVLISMRKPLLDASTNILGGINLLNAAKNAGVQHVVFSSSGGTVYGEPAYLPVAESAPLLPLSPYGISKLTFEHYLRISGLSHTILRYANVYGPRQSPHGEAGVIAIFAERMLKGLDTVIYGDGNQERDFVYVSDVVAANLAALEGKIEGIFNIGTGVGTTINRIYNLVSQAADYPHPQHHAERKEGEVYKIILDCRHASTGLHWEAQIGLEEGIYQTVQFFRQQV